MENRTEPSPSPHPLPRESNCLAPKERRWERGVYAASTHDCQQAMDCSNALLLATLKRRERCERRRSAEHIRAFPHRVPGSPRGLESPQGGRDIALRCPRRVQRRNFFEWQCRSNISFRPLPRGRGRRSAPSLPSLNTYCKDLIDIIGCKRLQGFE